MRWPTLTVLPGRFVRDDWRANEADLVFSVEREGSDTPVLVYVLLEHQSTPDQWLRLRLLGYCVQVWLRWHRQHEDEERLPLLVPLLERATRLIGELYRAAGFEEVAKHVEYVLATQPEEHRKLFSKALRRNVPGRGGELMNYVEELIEQGRQEGRREGELKGQVRAIEGFVARDIPWSTIEAATGIDEATFRRLRQRIADAD